MKRAIIFLVFLVVLSSFASAEIILGQVNDVYNKGELLITTATVKSNLDTEGIFSTSIICGGIETKVVPIQYIEISIGKEVEIPINIKLVESLIGTQKGDCVVKTDFLDFSTVSNSFYLSNLLNINLISEQTDVEPEEIILIEGTVIKENNQPADGYIELSIEPLSVYISETVTGGRFKFEFSLPKETAYGEYSISFKAYEKDRQEMLTNQGFANQNLYVQQIPTSLELLIENTEIEPGTTLQIVPILHDQTGENIEETVSIFIKDKNLKTLEQAEVPTNEPFEFEILYNKPPQNLTVEAVAVEKIEAEAELNIKSVQKLDIALVNRTIIVKNIGNVPYNNSITTNIGNESLTFDIIDLKVDGEQKYVLSAPDGEYAVEIVADGQTKFAQSVLLTGKQIDVKRAQSQIVNVISHPSVWIFIVLVLGFVAFLVFKKGYKKSFIGRIHKNKSKRKVSLTHSQSTVSSQNKAELSLSIKGEKQDASIVCVWIEKLKNAEDNADKKIQKKSVGQGTVENTLQKIVRFAEEQKAVTYENQETLFFILAPAKTKTFKNELTAIKIGQKAKEVLEEHNRLFKQKIDFGISLNYGTIVAKQEGEIFKFMSMGTLITLAKKISKLSKKQVLLSTKINERLTNSVKTEKHTRKDLKVYSVKEIKDRDQYKKFLTSFKDRMDKENKESK